MERPTVAAPPDFGGGRYSVPSERSLGWYLALSAALFVAGAFASALLPPADKLPPMIEVELGIDAIDNEPPPLGEPDAGAGEVQPEPPSETPAPVEEPQVQPPPAEPEPETEMAEPPAPETPPQFEVPEEVPPPKPKPIAVEKPKPKPVQKPAAETKPRVAAPTTTAAAGSGIAGAKAGVRGSPGGKVGGRGGGRGDFVSTPQPQYDATARQRKYQGRGVFIIRYENGRITSVSTQQSTGVDYLDARTTAWIKSRWRVKSDASGAASLPITWQLK